MIVVGCGPAGATAARVAAEHDRSVLIIDRKRSVGQPPRCAGFVPAWLPDRSGVDASSIIQRITSLHLEDGAESVDIPVDACVIDRTRFDKTLAIHALEAGADLCNGFVIRRREDVLIARRNGVEAEFTGSTIVCADGAASVVSRSLSGARRRFLATMQIEVGLEQECESVRLRRPVIADRGIGWFIPSGRTAKIGVALPRRLSRMLKPALNAFARDFEREGLIFPNAVLGMTGGLVPIDRGPLLDPDLRLVVAGDARGGLGVDGAGIANAVLSGELAGRTADRFLDENDVAVIFGYEEKLNDCLHYGRDVEAGSTCSAFQRWAERMRLYFGWRPDSPQDE